MSWIRDTDNAVSVQETTTGCWYIKQKSVFCLKSVQFKAHNDNIINTGIIIYRMYNNSDFARTIKCKYCALKDEQIKLSLKVIQQQQLKKQPTPWNRLLLQKLTDAHLVKNFPPF
jgi:hypothetical protein